MNPSDAEQATRAPWWWILFPVLHMLVLLCCARPAGLEWSIFATQGLITAFSSWRLFADPSPFSLNKVWWIFCMVFLSIMPSAQVAVHITPWHTGDIRPRVMLQANVLILLCLFVFEGVRLLFVPRFAALPPTPPASVSPLLARQFSKYAPLLMLGCGAALVAVVGPLGLIFRGHLEHTLWNYSTLFQVVFDKALRGTMIWCVLTAILLYRQKLLGKGMLTLLLLAGFLFNFPLATPRYLTLTMYLGAALAAGFSFFKKRHSFSLLLLSLLLLVAPLSSVTRYGGDDMGERMQRPDIVFQKAVILTDYDAWSSLCRVIQYTRIQGVTQGRQLMGTALFFVPRSVWPDKPIGSGAFLFDQMHLGFNNVACTFLAEGYINFGVLGSVLFAALMAFLVGRYDAWYWRQAGAAPFRLPRLFYYVAIGMLFYVLRGDLMSSYAYTLGFLGVCCFWQAVFFWRIRPWFRRRKH